MTSFSRGESGAQAESLERRSKTSGIGANVKAEKLITVYTDVAKNIRVKA